MKGTKKKLPSYKGTDNGNTVEKGDGPYEKERKDGPTVNKKP